MAPTHQSMLRIKEYIKIITINNESICVETQSLRFKFIKNEDDLVVFKGEEKREFERKLLIPFQ